MTLSTEHYCYGHMRPEDPAGAYLICPECFHVYRTAQDLLDLYNSERGRLLEQGGLSDLGDAIWLMKADEAETNPEQIFFCQVCLHDF